MTNALAAEGQGRGIGVYAVSALYGESIVVTLPDKKWFIVDAFEGSPDGDAEQCPSLALVDFLNLDPVDCCFFLLTHPHHDHMSGSAALLKSNPHYKLYSHAIYDFAHIGDEFFRSLGKREASLAQSVSWSAHGPGCKVEELKKLCSGNFKPVTQWDLLRSGHDVEGNNYLVKVISPSSENAARLMKMFLRSWADVTDPTEVAELRHRFSNRLLNNMSVCLLIQYGKARIILGGDLEHGAWRTLIKKNEDVGPNCDQVGNVTENVSFVKAPHHGSHGTFPGFGAIVENPTCGWALQTHHIQGQTKLPSDEGLGLTLDSGLTVAVPNRMWMFRSAQSARELEHKVEYQIRRVYYGARATPDDIKAVTQLTIDGVTEDTVESDLPELNWVGAVHLSDGSVVDWQGGSNAGFFVKS